jgi:hypothetical protein
MLNRQSQLLLSRRTALVGAGACGAMLLGAGPDQLRAAPDDLPRAILYEEDKASPTGQSFTGIAQWTVANSGASGSPVRASIAIPDRQLILKWTLQRNDDRSLPASHTIDLVFSATSDSPHGAIKDVPGVLMKADETARAAPFKAIAVKVSAGHFLVGLSNRETDRAINLELLKERDWFDIPMVYEDGGRAILAFEKGEAGKRVLGQVLAAWESASDTK